MTRHYMLERRYSNSVELVEVKHFFPASIETSRKQCIERYRKFAAENGFEIWVPMYDDAGLYRKPDSRDTLSFRP